MIVHYRLPNQGWLNPHSVDIDDLWTPVWQGDTFSVSTQAEFDYLQAYGLMKGKQLTLKLNPDFSNEKWPHVQLWLKDINTNPDNPMDFTC